MSGVDVMSGAEFMTTIYKTESGGREIERYYRELLRRWPVPHEEVRVPTGQGETFVVSSGPEDAPPLVLLHGSGTNAAMWQAEVPSWSEHFRVHAVDMIGEPGLSAPSRPPLDSDAYALWLDEVLRGLGITTTAIVGASLGGWLAVDYATRRPDRVNNLVLLCPAGIGRQKLGWLPKALLLRPFGRWGQRKTVALVAGLRDARATELLDYLALVFSTFRPRRKLPVFSDDALRRLEMPVLVVVGERDAMLDSAETVRRVEKTVPRATVRLLPGVEHSVLGQAEPVLEFLRG
jgi:pimeloyl-ACP methyl ester carboxylesterase